MNFKNTIGLTVSVLALSLVVLGDANAAGVSVKCEVGKGRSKASVDGSGVRGTYVAKLRSGGVTRTSKPQTADPVTNEVEFDFDSRPNDIRAGATAIGANFIKSGKVTGGIYAASNGALIAQAGATCRVR